MAVFEREAEGVELAVVWKTVGMLCVYSLFCRRQGRRSRVEARLIKSRRQGQGELGCVVVAPLRAGDWASAKRLAGMLDAA